MKRRAFLQTSVAVTTGVALSGFPIGAYGYSPELAALTNAATATDKVLVIVQLQGGNDGLNMIIPVDQYAALAAARPTIMLPQNQVLPLTTATGMHPAMSTAQQLFQNGQLGVVQSVGYPNPNFSHFRATDIWTSGSSSDVVLTTGWGGRYLDGEFPGYPTGYPSAATPDPLAVSIGSVVSNCVQGPVVNMGMAIASTSSFYQLLSGGVDAAPATPAGHELTFIRQVVSQTQVYTTTIQTAASKAKNLSPLYPAAGQNALADQLRIVAQLVAGGLSTRIYVCQLGGFDLHSNQVPTTGSTTGGAHAALLGKLADGINAFQDDLRRLGVQERVIGLTFSEFGRRIKANASYGTDHGAAAPLLVFGAQANPLVHGANPTLPASAGVNDNVAMQIDFRSVYTSILKDWFQVPQATLNQLFGQSFSYVPVIKQAALATVPGAAPVMGFSLYPNPARAQATALFESQGEPVQLSIFDGLGREVSRPVDGRPLGHGPQRVPLPVAALAPGAYHCVVREGSRSSSLVLVVAE